MPNQMKTPPLIQWARPEKMPEPSWEGVSGGRMGWKVWGQAAYEETPKGYNAGAEGDEAEDEDDAVHAVVQEDEELPEAGGDYAGGLLRHRVDST